MGIGSFRCPGHAANRRCRSHQVRQLQGCHRWKGHQGRRKGRKEEVNCERGSSCALLYTRKLKSCSILLFLSISLPKSSFFLCQSIIFTAVCLPMGHAKSSSNSTIGLDNTPPFPS